MCGRYTLTGTDRGRLGARFSTEVPDSLGGLLGRFNAAPGQEILVVSSEDGAPNRAEAAHWGLVPAWAPDLKTGYRMINARAETVLESRAYSPLIRSSSTRCLVPADGFFEWTEPADPGGPRRPVRFTVDSGQPFAMAGLRTEREWEGGRLVSCTIITTEANDAVSPIHDRMPVVLAAPEAEAVWLDPSIGPEEAQGLLRPLDASRVSARMASTDLNRVGAFPEGPDLLESP